MDDGPVYGFTLKQEVKLQIGDGARGSGTELPQIQT